ncbi:hypothetical protein SSYRP_v1c09530 [Spiroplasma syrphidicola EA-1]|uniref:Uncharacterized protein n=1 Tax=Spiroplasma syrphidicola EA-1 TaxID=1276229 RepID=R4UK69_9MOLU|nr:hypothetical protein [Spiroplasma syrphidicola]AGM26540.1 hypothetical protein SSYRP_v1c09530 [Spiroplasma syrphidicola EA-1]
MKLPLLRVICKYWFTSWHTYLLSFVLPVALYFISTRVTNMFNSNASFLALPGSILLAVVINGLVDLPIAFFEFKQTTFARQLHLLQASTGHLIISLLFINFCVSIAAGIWLVVIAIVSYHQAMHLPWINWLTLGWTVILASFTSGLIGIMIGYFHRDLKIILVLAISVFLILAFLTGMLFPLGVIRSDQILNFLGYFFPTTFLANLMNSSFFWNVPSWILDSNLYPNLTYFSQLHNIWLPTIISFAWILAFTSIIFWQNSYQDK